MTSRLVVGLLKDLFERERPAHFLETGHPVQTFWITGGDCSPSGHVGRYFGIFLPLLVPVPRYRLPSLIVPLYIVFGRLNLTLHDLSDVLASLSIVIIVTTLYSHLLRTGKRDDQIVTSIHETMR